MIPPGGCQITDYYGTVVCEEGTEGSCPIGEHPAIQNIVAYSLLLQSYDALVFLLCFEVWVQHLYQQVVTQHVIARGSCDFHSGGEHSTVLSLRCSCSTDDGNACSSMSVSTLYGAVILGLDIACACRHW